MKTIYTYIFSILILCFIQSCSFDPRAQLPQTGAFGKPFTEEAALSVEAILSAPDSITKQQLQVSGIIDNYCKGEGCWLTLKNANGEALHTEIEYKAFQLPRNIDGKTAVVQGYLVKDSLKGRQETRFVTNGIIIK